jgi:predicted transposase YdaD
LKDADPIVFARMLLKDGRMEGRKEGRKERRKEGRKEGRTDGCVTISLRNFVGEGIISKKPFHLQTGRRKIRA